VREICIDANVIVKLPLKGEPFRAKARSLIKECGAKKIAIIAPPLYAIMVSDLAIQQVHRSCLLSCPSSPRLE